MPDPAALAASVTALAVAIANGKDADEISLLGAVFTQLGDTLATISLQQTLNDANRSGSPAAGS